MAYFKEALTVMSEQFGQDTVMSLATVNDGKANVRNINAYYKAGAFYITTYALSRKMQEIARNPSVALCYHLFVAHGEGENLGHPLKAENLRLRNELKQVFSAFYDQHVDETDANTCILKITPTDALVFANNYKYRLDFQKATADREDFIVDIVF